MQCRTSEHGWDHSPGPRRLRRRPHGSRAPINGVPRASTAAAGIDTTAQHGEARHAAANGSSHARSTNRRAAKSATVCSRIGIGARSGRPVCCRPRRQGHARW